jgi:anti-anti-sigma regulatory factor
MTANIICEAPAERVRVVRFLRPDLRPVLDHHGHAYGDIADCPLYREVRAEAAALPEGGALVLNFGLVDLFTSAFMRFLLQTQIDLRAKGCRLLLCCLPPHVNESYALMAGPKTFEPALATEAEAVRVAKG